uniref:NB-ARC domain-containing protein n=1 Tax=Oryza meridionalis TaxID=40149 RepID=A0A0E0C935_9ORYZ
MDRRLVTFPKCLGTLSSILCIDVHRMCTVDLAASSHMPCLRAAGEFCVDKSKVQGLEVLKQMNELQGSLAITSLENVKSRDEATDAQLFRKSQIFKLKLQWGSSNASSKSDKANDVFDALRPHSGLEELIVQGYPGCVSPSWLESEWLSRLRHISISDCKCWKLLPSLGQIQSLRTLRIARLNAVVCIGPEFYGTAGFPSLEILEMIELPELAEWSSVDCFFPALLEVCIRGCPKLKQLPPVVLPPVRMSIYVSTEVCRLRNHNRLETCFTQEVSLSTLLDMLHLRRLEPVKCVNIIFEGANTLEDGLKDVTTNLPSLEELVIRGCSDLQHAFAASKQREEDGNGFSSASIQCLKMIGCNLTVDIFLSVFQNISFLSLWINDCNITYSTPERVLAMPKSVTAVLEKLCILSCDGLTAFMGLETFLRLSTTEIASCPKLTSVPDFRCLPALQNLIIKNCPELKELPENGNLTTLTALVVEPARPFFPLKTGGQKLVLIIKNCPKVVSLPEDGLPVSLNCLYLAGCHPVLEEQFDQKNGSEWEKYEVLPFCFFADKSIEDIEGRCHAVSPLKGDSRAKAQSWLSPDGRRRRFFRRFSYCRRRFGIPLGAISSVSLCWSSGGRSRLAAAAPVLAFSWACVLAMSVCGWWYSFFFFPVMILQATGVGWVVSPVIKLMFEKVQSYISTQYKWQSNLVDDLKKLETILTEILLVVGTAERRRTLDCNQQALLRQLKDAVYDAEDIMDEFDYMFLKANAQKRKLRSLGSSSISIAKRLVGHDKFRSKLGKMLKSLSTVKECAHMLVRVMGVENFSSHMLPEPLQWRISSSISIGEFVVGRQKEREELVHQLLEQSDKPESRSKGARSTSLEVITIVGNGGIGKTTLAQLIYNDKRIEDNFDMRAWVCVSHVFDKVRITKEILTTIDKSIDLTNFNFSMLQEELKNKITMKKFLLVLDDVWYDEKVGVPINADRWRELFAPLWHGAKVIKILVTTRMGIVANTLGCATPFCLSGLESKDSWELFRRCAFSTRDPNEHLELKSIGEHIVQKLNGSALAIKAVGGHLSSNFNYEEWNRVLKSGLSNEKDIMTILRLSYECLPEHLQQCFSFCGLFPKGYYFEPDMLVNMWIAHEFIQDRGRTYGSLTSTGKSYFDELLSRSFFQALRYGGTVHYVMHDLMNDLAVHVSNGKCYRVEANEPQEIFPEVQHLSILAERVDLLHACKLQRLRTLIIWNKERCYCSRVCVGVDFFKEFKSLRLLDLTGCCLRYLPDLNHMIHLRCLILPNTNRPLPDSLCSLYHLFLHRHSCFICAKHVIFPKNLDNLSNILTIDVHRDLTVDLASVGHMPYLRAAGEFCVEKRKAQGLEVLHDMNELRGFLIFTSLENVKNKDEAIDAQLVNKSQISRLDLQWSFSNADSQSDKEYDVLNALTPHPCLEELNVEGYSGCTSPCWLESKWLSRLQHISIHDCTCWKLPSVKELHIDGMKSLECIGTSFYGDALPSLRELHIDGMKSLECIGTSFYGDAGFPSLKTLELTELPELADWSSIDYAFPVLHDVLISRCPKLKELPPVFPPPVKMEVLPSTIVYTQHTDHRLDTCITQKEESVEIAEISFDGADMVNDGLRDLGPNLPSHQGPFICWYADFHRAFASLTEMKIVGCPNITSLLDFRYFPVLKNLIIQDCPELNELQEDGHLTTLTEVLIEHCNKLVSLRSLRNLSFLSKLEIRNCLKLVALPEMFDFFSLRVMIIHKCPEIVSLPEDGLPLTLNFLYLNGCHPLLEEQFEWQHGVEWEKYAMLPSCLFAGESIGYGQVYCIQLILQQNVADVATGGGRTPPPRPAQTGRILRRGYWRSMACPREPGSGGRCTAYVVRVLRFTGLAGRPLAAGRAASYISSQFTWKSEMMSDLKNLESTLSSDVIAPNDAVCEADDVLDEFDYLIKEKIEDLGMFSSVLSIGKRLVSIDKFRSKLQEVIKTLGRVRASAEMFAQVMAGEVSSFSQSPEYAPARATGSLLHEDTIFGRKNEIDELLFNTVVHSIVGVGGIGKTTLAQAIYNDERITEIFDLKIWVCVSHNFDKTRLTKEIIACTAGTEHIELASFNFSMLQEKLRDRLMCKRFLLVLDDVWYDERVGENMNRETWKELIAPIRNIYISSEALERKRTGSKILVTTRAELGLGKDDSRMLFRKCAFGNRNPEDYPELKIIEDQIVENLKGSALAIKVTGGHLSGKYNALEWNKILQKSVLNPNDIMTILRSSYESLPNYLQQCFTYCSLFPKGYRIDPNRLIHMWAAQGFVHSDRNINTSLEDIGRGYFNDLLQRSFFQVFRCGDQIYYIMHDVLNDLALHVSGGECHRIEHGSPSELPHHIRHLSVSAELLENFVSFGSLGRLRSLLVFNKSWFCSKLSLTHGILAKLKGVRVLDYHSCYSSGKFSSHCSSHKLLNLSWGQVNIAGGCFSLPESINRLSNLVHVDIEKSYALMLIGMHQLPCVEGSGEFHVGKKGQSIVELKDLNELRGELAIRFLENVKTKEEAAKANLDLKKHIRKLELEWGSGDHDGHTSNGCDVLNVLKPHPNLVELTISGYPGATSPTWLNSGWLSSLQLICLRDCKKWEVLPPLGDLPLLKALEVRRMDELKILDQEFLGRKGFPSLERLLLERLPKLEWSIVENDQLFPALRDLSFSGCPRLREYPTYVRTLRHIAILDKEQIHFKVFMDNFELTRSFCCLLSSFFYVLRVHHLEFVEKLKIYVDHLRDIPKVAFNNMKQLKELTIFGLGSSWENTYPIISTLWDEDGVTVLPTSLQRLELIKCQLRASSLSKLLNNLVCLDTLDLGPCDTVGMPSQLSLSMHQLRMLRQLNIYKCYWLMSLEGSQSLVSLKELRLENCDNLESVPDMDNMPSLQILLLRSCPQVTRLYQSGCHTALEELRIESCDGLASLEDLNELVSLRKMKVIECSALISLPDMSTFYSLKILVIGRCTQLRALPRNGLPVSLKAFFLIGCMRHTNQTSGTPVSRQTRIDRQGDWSSDPANQVDQLKATRRN